MAMLLMLSGCASYADEPLTARATASQGAQQKLAGKTIVITGASSGFGKGIALELARQGANLVLASRRADALNEVVRECGANAIAVKTDVTDPQAVQQLAQAAVDKFGRFDVWINDAGAGAIGRFTDIPLEDHAKVVQTDLIGVIYGSHCAIRQFEMQKQGILINLASIVGVIPIAYYSTYSAAKFGVSGLDKGLRAELRADKANKIRVCTVYPMATDTPFWNHAANYTHHTMQPPLLHQPENVVAAIVKLVTKPKDEVFVGPRAKLAVKLHEINPGLIEKIVATSINKDQIETDAPGTKPTDGSLLKPMLDGSEVKGGVAQRMKAEKDSGK